MVETVGRYEIVAALRAGGMARVDLARLRGAYDFCRYVVIKRPLPHHASDPIALEQFQTEARLLAGLHHPSVISFLEAGRDDAGVDYLALEYVHGMSLRDLAPPRGPQLVKRPSLAAALTIVKEIGDALDHAHDHGAVVHRDVSPSNVLLGYDGSIKLIDFGIAKLTDGATASGTLRGKITYMAPEQCKGEPIDRRTDVYALGVMLYELVTGQRPFYADDDIASLHKIVAGAPPPHAKTFGVDPALAEIVMRAMAHRAPDRYASAAAFVAAIEAYAAAHAIVLGNALIGEELGEVRPEPWRVATPARPTVPVKRSRRPVFAVIAAAATLAAAVAIYVGLARPPAARQVAPTPQPPVAAPAPAPTLPPPAPVIRTEPTGTPAAAAPAPVQKRSRKPRPSKPPAADPPPVVEAVTAETPSAPKQPQIAPVAKPAAPGVWNSRSFDLPNKP